jgi:GGDEF domain-containing protein
VGDARLAVLWGDVPVAVARIRMEQLRDRLAAQPTAATAGIAWPTLTLSIGVAHHAGSAGRGLLHRAEVALHAARQTGGSRVVCWDRWGEPYSYLASVDQLPG